MAEVNSPVGYSSSVDEETVTTGRTALYVDGQRIEQAILHECGAPRETGSVMYGIGGSKRVLYDTTYDPVVIPVRRSIFSRDLRVDILVDAPANTASAFRVVYGSVTQSLDLVGSGTASHQDLEWVTVLLPGIGDGSATTRDLIDAEPAEDLRIEWVSGGAVWIFAVAWTELHNERLST
jgi:hypothetical protein